MNKPPVDLSGKFIVGVTGNIATGKSAVMRLAAEESALTIDADKLVHELMDRDADMQAAIAVAFGPGVRRPDGRINRRALGEIVFNDADAMRDLEEMVHPAVSTEVFRRIAESDRPLIFLEAIKLLEGNLVEICQQVWVTRCSKKRQLDRLRICRGMDTQSAAARIKAQPPQEEKVARADVVIDTDGYMIETAAQFEKAWQRLPEWVKVTPRSKPAATKFKAKTAHIPAERPAKTRPAAASDLQRPATDGAAMAAASPARPDNLEVRRARPSDIPSILLLIQKATGGKVKMKRAELLMALSDRSYFIGQIGAEISTVIGWNIDSQIASIDQLFVYPSEAFKETGLAIIEEIEKSAQAHICEIIVVFLAQEGSAEVVQFFASLGYEVTEVENLPPAWRRAIEETRPEDTFTMVKVLRHERLKRAQAS